MYSDCCVIQLATLENGQKKETNFGQAMRQAYRGERPKAHRLHDLSLATSAFYFYSMDGGRTVARRKDSFGRSSNAGTRSRPTTRSSSSWARLCTSGFKRMAWSHHESPPEVVSPPALKESKTSVSVDAAAWDNDAICRPLRRLTTRPTQSKSSHCQTIRAFLLSRSIF